MTLSRLRMLCLGILFHLIPGSQLRAQEFDESNFIRYTRLQGLSNNFVSGIVQDSTGYIWIATHKGLNRFDGKYFQSVFKSSSGSPLPDNQIQSLHTRSGHEIIGATRAGAFAFNPENGQHKQFVVPCDSIIFFWANNVFDICKDKLGNYIVSTKTGMYIFDSGGKLIRRYDHHQPKDVGNQELIYGGWVNSLTDGSSFQQNGLLGSLYDPYLNRIDTLFVEKRVWLKKLLTDSMGEMKMAWGNRHGELVILNTDRNTLDVASIYSPVSSSSPMPFSVSADLGWSSKLSFINDSLFSITCRNSGFYLVHFNFRTGQLNCDGKKYFAHEACTAVFKDREGRIWVGTADGVYKQNLHNSFFSVTDLSQHDSQMVNHDIRSIYMDNHSIFAGLMNEGGLLVLDKKTGMVRNHIRFSPPAPSSNSILNIFPYSEDTLWIATLSGILWLNKENLHFGQIKTPPELSWMQKTPSRTFFEDSRKNIWISFASLNTLVRYNRASKTFSAISTAENPLLKITFVISMAEDIQGNLWLAGDGLCRWNLRKQMVDTLIPFPRVSRLLLNYMYILDRDSANNLWLSSYDNQIVQFNCSSGTITLRQQENNNMDGNTVTSSHIIQDCIWMGTDNGISAFNVSNYSVKQFTYADGLPSVAITTIGRGSFYDREANRFYLGAKHRLISFTPDVNLSRKLAPMLFIEKLTTRDSVIRSVSNIVRLKFSQNNLTIYFNTINYTDPEENRFSWRSLQGNDTSWNDVNNQNSITLTNLEGGMNSVQIKLLSANNHWPQQVKTLFVYIQPPFWKSTWFIFLFATGLAALILFIYKTRVNNIRKKEREKARVQRLIAEEYKNQFELEQISNYFSSSLASIKNVDDVLWDVTKNLIGRMNYEDCIIYMWNADKTRMVQKAAYGPKGNPKTISSQAFDVEPGQGVVGHVMLTKEPQLVCDTRKDPRYRIDDMNRLSELSVPIIHNDELIGIIDSEHHRMNHFKERDLKMLTTIATLVGNKIKQIESEQSLDKKQKEIAFINQQLAEAQLSALQTQMNPHFIFNSLNSIKGMILENEQLKASRYLTRFAQMIRITLNQSKEVFTTLYENLEHLDSYLVMEKLRFDDSFTYRVIVDECIDKEETLIPTLMIQPLVENAIWHGLMHNEGEKRILIHFARLEETITCTIEDNGIGIIRSEELKKLHRPSHNSVGLNNLRNRIQIMNEKYDIDCSLVISDLRLWNPKTSGTCAVLRFKILTSKLHL